jgi:uncharacterized YccA/Bax inhibitor family protein
MSNPMLNDDRLRAAAAASDSQAGWAAPQPGTQWNPPITDGPISRLQTGVMTVAGTAQVTAILLGLLLVSGAFGWAAVKVDTAGNAEFPPLAIVGILVGIGCVFGLMFKPQLAKIIAPIYAIAQGFAVGAISRGYETYQKGIVLQAVGATLGVFLVMLFLYRTNVIKVTEKYRRIVIGATLGIMVFYGVSLLIRLFGGNVPFLDSPCAFGIIFSLVVAAIAAANLALDFDFIERGAQQRLPKNVEWFAAFGLLVTIVWLYLEILRLLSKLNRR